MRIALPGTVVFCLGAASVGLATEDASTEKLQSLEREAAESQSSAEQLAHQSRDLEDEVRTLQVSLVGAARKAQAQESKLLDLEESLADLQREEESLLARLDQQQQHMQLTLAALERIALLPEEAQLLAPGTPLDRIRSAMLLQVAVPAIEQRADTLKSTLVELANVRDAMGTEKSALQATTAKLARHQDDVAHLISRKSATWKKVAKEQKQSADRASRLAQEATDLRGLLAVIAKQRKDQAQSSLRAALRTEEQRQAAAQAKKAAPAASEGTAQAANLDRPTNLRDFPEEGANLILPARGTLTVRYGQANDVAGESRESSKGIVIAARDGAQVVAPFDGEVVYAGPFRSYGKILIIDHGQRYHSLLAGLGTIEAVVGQWVLAGEPLATMSAGQDLAPNLYVELRRAGQPINPLPWLDVAELRTATTQQ